jgi:hypothetical protein
MIAIRTARDFMMGGSVSGGRRGESVLVSSDDYRQAGRRPAPILGVFNEGAPD